MHIKGKDSSGITLPVDRISLAMQLNAGPVQLSFDNGSLRTFLANGEEVVQMMHLSFRDPQWNTAAIVLTSQQVHQASDSFTITYDWQVNDLGIQMTGNAQISGQSDGTVTFDFYGKATGTFQRNRIGICVLHPIAGLAGQPCRIEHTNGNTTDSLFPVLIPPSQPFQDIRSLTWQMASGRAFRLAFFGEVFETEDQRNFTDSSYKTYPTPVSLPTPVTVEVGTEIRQQLVFTVENSGLPVRPRIGLGHRPDGPPLSQAEAEVLKTLNLSHLRTEVHLTKPDWPGNLLTAQLDASLLGVPLELALFFGDDAAEQARQFVQFAIDHALHLYTLSLFGTDTGRTSDPLLNDVLPVLRELLPHIKLGGGTNAHFIDLNSHRFDFSRVDFVTYAMTPQVHLNDDLTVMENVAGQADTVLSARVLSGGKPVHISPVTLLPRYNADAPPTDRATVPPADPRQKTTFGAEWTRRSLTSLSQIGAASVTYYETHGPRGLLDGREIFPVFESFS